MTGASDDRGAARARDLLLRPGAWLDARAGGYDLRLTDDRRRRPALRLDEALFDDLVRDPGLRPREAGGWTRLRERAARPDPPPGRPGVLLGERIVPDAQGRPERRTVNLGESPLAWLLRRGWLTAVEAAAGERLREEGHRAALVGRLTMSWDAGPRSAGGRGPGLDPAERARAAKDRVHAALEAAGPGLREMLERVCLSGTALEAAERDLHLPRRSGKAVLKLALGRLAAHYRLG